MGLWVLDFQAAGGFDPPPPFFNSFKSAISLRLRPQIAQAESSFDAGVTDETQGAWSKAGSRPRRANCNGPAGSLKSSRFEDLRTEARGTDWEKTPELDEAEAVNGRWNSQKNQSDGSGYGDQDQLDGTSPKPAGSTQELKKSQDLNGTDQWGAEFEGDYFPEDEGWDY